MDALDVGSFGQQPISFPKPADRTICSACVVYLIRNSSCPTGTREPVPANKARGAVTACRSPVDASARWRPRSNSYDSGSRGNGGVSVQAGWSALGRGLQPQIVELSVTSTPPGRSVIAAA